MTAPLSPLISILIPAWERPALLLAAVNSCLAQTYGAFEVVIADDSQSDAVERAMAPLLPHAQIRYVRNARRLGQSGNVNGLIEIARGERLLLLHDDDLLFPDALALLDRRWREHPGVIACYGKQWVISHAGRALAHATRDFDRNYHRTAAHAGVQQSKPWAALVEQMPPDGALIDTAAARATLMRSAAEVGDDCDYDFIVRLAQREGDFCFVDRYVTKYRMTDTGVASRKTADHTFAIARDMALPAALEPARESLLRARAAYAVRAYVLTGRRQEAREVVRNERYWNGRFSRGRLSSALLLLAPRFMVQAVDSARRAVGRILRRREGMGWRTLRRGCPSP